MAGNIATQYKLTGQNHKTARLEPKAVQIVLVALTLIFFILILIIPLISVFIKAFEQGLGLYLASITDPMALKAVKLTLVTVGFSVLINTAFGLTVAWAVAKFRFKGKNLLLTFIDLPLAISPIVAGLIFVLLFSTTHGLLAPILNALEMKIIFAPAGIILATLFVTLPFVARELIPLMEAQGTAEEEAALTLGASDSELRWQEL